MFCVVLTGSAALNPPPEDVSLAVRRWSGCIDSLDMTIYAAERIAAGGLLPALRRLAISLAASIAVFDPLIVERLAQEPVASLLDPRPVLAEIARERGWTAADVAAADWSRGMSDYHDGRAQRHSALLALADDTNELNSRIWRAEVTAVLPYLEEQRRELLSRYSGLLSLPFTTRFGEVITDPFDLELAHLAIQLGRLRASSDYHVRAMWDVLPRFETDLRTWSRSAQRIWMFSVERRRRAG